MISIKHKHKKRIEYLADLILSYYIKKLRAPRCSATFLKLLREVYDIIFSFVLLTIFAAAAAAAGASAVRRLSDGGAAAFGRRFGGAPAAAAAAAKIENLRRVGRLDGRSFRTRFDARFEFNLTPVSKSIWYCRQVIS